MWYYRNQPSATDTVNPILSGPLNNNVIYGGSNVEPTLPTPTGATGGTNFFASAVVVDGYINNQINNYNLSDYDKLYCEFANLNIDLIDENIYFNYKFKISLTDSLPIYIENIMGMMMKKIFYNIKLFIEKISN